MRVKSLDLKSFARKIYEVCPLVRPKPEHSDSIHSNSIHAAPSGSLESPPLMDMLLVLQHKEFNVAKTNQVDSADVKSCAMGKTLIQNANSKCKSFTKHLF